MTGRPFLSIDPAIQGGAVCIPGTRIPAEVIGGNVWAGESVADVAWEYDVSHEMVLLCCWWWGEDRRWLRGKHGRQVEREWGGWIDDAKRHFAKRLHPDKLADPPKRGAL